MDELPTAADGMNAQRRYSYVGPHGLNQYESPHGLLIESRAELRRWAQVSEQVSATDATYAATFIVDTAGNLRIAPRRSEHVACAGGQDVLSAGEITFFFHEGEAKVLEITNQSTGYCPEPDSWPAVDAALEKIGVKHPAGFTTPYVFRRCENCGMTNIVKEGWFVCGVCEAALNQVWNFGNP